MTLIGVGNSLCIYGLFPIARKTPRIYNIIMFAPLRNAFTWLDRHTGGALGILQQSFRRFLEMRGTEAAASLAYYALFSLFPLTLFLIALLGMVVQSGDAYRETVGFIRNVFPFSGDVVGNNLKEVMKQRGPLSIIGLIAILWSASGYFNTLAYSINRAWPAVKLRSLVQNRLVALGMIGALALFLILSLLTTMITGLLPYLKTLLGDDGIRLLTGGWLLALRLGPVLFTFLIFAAMYQWVPNKKVRWRAVIIGALFAAITWELARLVFTYYLNSGIVHYEFVYGSLGALIALMLWIYLSNLLSLFGAYIVAELDVRSDQVEQKEEVKEAVVEARVPHPGPGQSKGIRG
jgi:membrane protein